MSQRSRRPAAGKPHHHLGQLPAAGRSRRHQSPVARLQHRASPTPGSAGQAGPPAWPARRPVVFAGQSAAAEATGAGRSVCRRSSSSVHGNRGFPDGRSGEVRSRSSPADLTVQPLSGAPRPGIVCGRDETKPAQLIRASTSVVDVAWPRRHPGHPGPPTPPQFPVKRGTVGGKAVIGAPQLTQRYYGRRPLTQAHNFRSNPQLSMRRNSSRSRRIAGASAGCQMAGGGSLGAHGAHPAAGPLGIESVDTACIRGRLLRPPRSRSTRWCAHPR